MLAAYQSAIKHIHADSKCDVIRTARFQANTNRRGNALNRPGKYHNAAEGSLVDARHFP